MSIHRTHFYLKLSTYTSFFCRLVTAGKESAVTKLLSKAIPNSEFDNAYHKNMDNNSYQSISGGLNSIFSNSKTALFFNSIAVKSSEEYLTCQVV